MAKISMKLPTNQSDSTTLQDLLKDFLLQGKIKNLSEATMKSYQWQFNVFTRYQPPNTVLSTVTEATVKQVIEQMLDEGSKPVSVNTMLRHMNAIFNYAYSVGLVQKSPKVQLLKAQQEVKECYTEQEVIVLLKKPEVKSTSFREFRTWTIINTLVATGIRLKTVSNIKICDLDFENCLLKLTTLKNKKVQLLPMSKALVPILKEYMKFRKGSGDDYLFCSESNTKLFENSIYHDIASYNTSRGVSKTSPHLFRHTFAKHFVRMGGDPIRLQKWLGHSTLNMTRNYCNLYDTDLQDVAERFNLLESLSTVNKDKIKMK